MSNTKIANALDLMDSFLASVRSEKRALSATSGPEPTTHPVMGADDGTTPAREGARSSENEADVRSDYGEQGNTGQEDSAAAGDGSVPADSIGTQSQASDEVKGNVAQPKGSKDDPAENGRGDASPGHPTNMTFNEKYSSALDLGAEILQGFAKKSAEEEEEEDEEEEDEAEKAAAARMYPADAEAGYMAAHAIAEHLGFGKEAAVVQNQLVEASVEQIIKAAQEDAVNLHEYLVGAQTGAQLGAGIRKQAEDMPVPPELPPELLAAGGGELPPELLAGGGEPSAEGAGVPAEALMGGEGDEDAAIEELAAALEEAGVTPEELAEAVAAAEGEGGEGGEGEALAEETTPQ